MEERYLRPDYSEEEELPYDSGPSEDDDDDIDEDISNDQEDEGKIETFLDRQENLNNKYMQSSGAFTTGNNGNNNGGSSWGNNGSSPWSQNNGNNPSWNSGSSWSRNTTPWSPSSGSSWNSGNNNSPWNNNGTNGGKKELNRDKKVIFCDVLDCLVETYQSGGKPGLIPRGIYDVRLRFEVWDKLGCFTPDRIYAMVPKQFLLSSNGSQSWKIMLEYVSCSLSEYLRLPFMNCQIVTQTVIGQPKEVMMSSIIEGGKIPKDTIVQIGIDSGLYGQNNRDKLAAMKCGIDYIDLGELMNLYF